MFDAPVSIYILVQVYNPPLPSHVELCGGPLTVKLNKHAPVSGNEQRCASKHLDVYTAKRSRGDFPSCLDTYVAEQQ